MCSTSSWLGLYEQSGRDFNDYTEIRTGFNYMFFLLTTRLKDLIIGCETSHNFRANLDFLV